VGGHVVVTLEGVGPVGRAFWHRAVEPGIEVGAHFGRGILVQGQRGRGVLNQEVEKADLEVGELWQRAQHLAGDQVDAARARLEADGPL
jgi:hypothetical protein